MTPRHGLYAATLMLAAVGAAGAADAPIVVESVRIGLTEQPREGVFKVGTWTPVLVELTAGADRFQGTLEVVVPDDDGTATIVRQPVDLQAKQSRVFNAYVRPGARSATFVARAVDGRGRVAGREREESGSDWVDARQTVVALLGSPRGVDEVSNLPGFASNMIGGSDVRVIKVRPPRGLTPGSIPGRWYGYDAADVVVLDTGDEAVMADLNAAGKAGALEEWVRQGGHLVVAGASSNRVLADNELLRRMLPAVPRDTIRLNDLGALESFAGTARFGRDVRTMTAAVLELAPGHNAQVLASTLGATPTNLVVRGAWGFGRVTIAGLDTGLSPFADWPGKKDFWVKVLDLRGRVDASAGVVNGLPGGGGFYRGGASDLAGVLHQGLERFPGVRLVPFAAVAGFVFIYILMIGPGDYFFLKRVLKRMELTWITFPLIVVGVSTAAYLGAYAVKGRELRVNKVDVIDVDQGDPKGAQLRGHTWLSLFSPQNRDYGVAFEPRALDGSGPLAGGDRATLASWFGSPEPILAGGNRLGLSGAAYSYTPTNEAEALEGVRVAIWSTRAFAGRWSGPCPPALDADLTPQGADRLNGTVANRLNRPLKDVWLAFGNQVYLLGDLAPGESAQVELAPNRVLASLLEERATNFKMADGNAAAFRSSGGVVYPTPGGTPAGPPPFPRLDVLRVAMFRDVLTTRAGALTSVPLRDLDLTGQLALERPMLVATIDGEGAALRLTGNSSTPITTQETLLRVILPLKVEGPK